MFHFFTPFCHEYNERLTNLSFKKRNIVPASCKGIKLYITLVSKYIKQIIFSSFSSTTGSISLALKQVKFEISNIFPFSGFWLSPTPYLHHARGDSDAGYFEHV